MNVVNLPMDRLRAATWSPNRMGEAMIGRLRESIKRYGVVENLVVRALDDGLYEVIGGNQRFRVLRESGVTEVPCVVVGLDDPDAMLLGQALNSIEGVDDLGLKAELVRKVLEAVPQHEILSVLPESAESLASLSSLGQADIASHLAAWQQAQAARLRHLQFQLTHGQLDTVEEALEQALAGSTSEDGNPNRRSNALVTICRSYVSLMEATS